MQLSMIPRLAKMEVLMLFFSIMSLISKSKKDLFHLKILLFNLCILDKITFHLELI